MGRTPAGAARRHNAAVADGTEERQTQEHPPDARFSLANERTFLAYVRTSLALIAGGVAIGQLTSLHSAGRLVVALPPILGGMAVAAAGFRRWSAIETALRERREIPPAFAGRLALGVVALALAAVVVVIGDFLR